MSSIPPKKRPREADSLIDDLTEIADLGWKRRGTSTPVPIMRAQVSSLRKLLAPAGYHLTVVDAHDKETVGNALTLLKTAFTSKENHEELQRALCNKDKDAAGEQFTLLLCRDSDGAAVSSINGKAHHSPLRFFEIAWMATSKSCRGQGVGRLLCAALKTLCHYGGISTVLVHVDGPQRSGPTDKKSAIQVDDRRPAESEDGLQPPEGVQSPPLLPPPKVELIEEKWVACDHCDKWRILDPGAEEPGDDEQWNCSMLAAAYRTADVVEPGNCGQRELTAEETAVARDPWLYLAEEDDSCLSVAKRLGKDPKAFVHANREIHGNWLTMTMKFKEGTILVIPNEHDMAEIRRQEEEKLAKENARREGNTPAERFWIKQDCRPLSSEIKQSGVLEVVCVFEDTGLLEYPMSEFPLSGAPPPEHELLREAIQKLKP